MCHQGDLPPGGPESGWGGVLHLGGGCPASGVYIQGGWEDPPDTWDTAGYGQQEGDTHPTGIHSCPVVFFR